MRPALLALVLVGLIDRIEGDLACVEWSPDQPFGLLPVAALPPDTAEGDAIRLRMGPHRVVVRSIPTHRAHRARQPRRDHGHP